jgi:hypothetical protein
MVNEFKILALTQGWYGERIVLNIKSKCPKTWKIFTINFSKNIPNLLDEPEKILPKDIPKCDLILSLGESPIIALTLPYLVSVSKAKSVVVPIDNCEWIPPAVKRQVLSELAEINVTSVFPKPFCSLDVNSGNKFIDEFAKFFGRPELKIELKNDFIRSVKVLRESPCGSTCFAAKRLVNVNSLEAPTKAGLYVQTYPCLASRFKDIEYGDSLIHISAHIIKGTVIKALRQNNFPKRKV